MRLKKLELNGFKSFAKKTELDFASPVTAIVGPNGSGKSNIVESFRFVLGEQSMKAMRGQKSEDMIFNGSAERSRANRAVVKLVLDNSDRLINVDFSEVVIERVVHRDGDNEYLLNGSRVRLKDILELLSTAHVGVSNHHIISQGEADRILNAKPTERKEMIEDALGLKIYQFKKRESEKKLDKTEDNLREVELLRRELAPRIQFLKKQVEKIERANALKQDLTRSYLEYFKREYLYLNNQKQKIESERQQPLLDLQQTKNKVSELRNSLKQDSSRQTDSDKLDELDRSLDSLRDKKDQAARKLGQTEGQLSSLKQLQEKRKLTQEEARIPYQEVANLSQSLNDTIRSAEDNPGDVDHLNQVLKLVRDKLSMWLEKFKISSRDDLQEFETEIHQTEKQKQEQEHLIQQLKQEEKSLIEKHSRFQHQKEVDREQNIETERELFRLLNRQKDLESKLSQLRSMEDIYNRDLISFERALEEAGVLIGTAVLQYRDFNVHDTSGQTLSPENILTEPREKQEQRRTEIERQKIRLEEIGIGSSPEEVMNEYREATERDEFLARESEDLKHSGESLRQLIKELNQTLEEKFKQGLHLIDVQFKKFFTTMFGGGSASVKKINLVPRQTDSEEEIPEEDQPKVIEGVDIDISLPRKKIRNLMMLSGGERALTSIALTFAITQVNPPPFLVLDETDAALDESNSRRYSEMLKTLSKHSQLIIITHNRETMAQVDLLYGVTMDQSGSSQLLSIKFDEAQSVVER